MALVLAGCMVLGMGTMASAADMEVESGARLTSLEQALLEYSPELYDALQEIEAEHDAFHAQASEIQCHQQESRTMTIAEIRAAVKAGELLLEDALTQLADIKAANRVLFNTLSALNQAKQDEGSYIKATLKDAGDQLKVEMTAENPDVDVILELLDVMVGCYADHLALDYKTQALALEALGLASAA